MAIARVVTGGSIVGGQRWSTAVTLAGFPATVAPIDLAALATGYFNAFKTQLWTGSGVGKLAGANATSVTLDSTRVYVKPTSTAPATQVGVSTAASAAGLSNIASAPQVALVATLENGLAGRKNKGRMYLPCTSGGIGSATTFQMSTSDATAWATSVGNYLAAIRAIAFAGSGNIQPVVSSDTIGSPLVAVSVDTVLDTQRRRRDKILGARSRVSIIVG